MKYLRLYYDLRNRQHIAHVSHVKLYSASYAHLGRDSGVTSGTFSHPLTVPSGLSQVCPKVLSLSVITIGNSSYCTLYGCFTGTKCSSFLKRFTIETSAKVKSQARPASQIAPEAPSAHTGPRLSAPRTAHGARSASSFSRSRIMAPKRTSVSGKGGGGGGDDRVHVVVRIRPPVRKDEKFGEGSEALQCKELFCEWRARGGIPFRADVVRGRQDRALAECRPSVRAAADGTPRMIPASPTLYEDLCPCTFACG